MDISYGSLATHKFVTNVGLITSNGTYGNNIMACEWTHLISYSPGLIAISVSKDSATNNNIKKTKEFGVNLASIAQNSLSSLSGRFSGEEHDKISGLKKLGFQFYQGSKIKCLMIKDAALNVECKVIKAIDLKEYTLFIGEALAINVSDNQPLAYHQGNYWKLTEQLPKPTEEERQKQREVMDEFRR